MSRPNPATAAALLPVVLMITACGPTDSAAVPRTQEHLPAVPSDEAGAVAPPTPDQSPREDPGDSFDRARRSTTDPTSIWVVVNKQHPVTPRAFEPEIALVEGYQVARPVAVPLERLLAAGRARGLSLKIASAFRSYAYQERVHAQTVAERGQAAAEAVSARAGHSEHQTGLAVDLVDPVDTTCAFDACFARTPQGRWLARAAWRFGFLLRYRPESAAVTGYQAEPWHLRFVGRPLARELHRLGSPTLEEFFGVTGGDYLNRRNGVPAAGPNRGSSQPRQTHT